MRFPVDRLKSCSAKLRITFNDFVDRQPDELVRKEKYGSVALAATESLSSIVLPFFSINWFRHPHGKWFVEHHWTSHVEPKVHWDETRTNKSNRNQGARAPQEERDSDERPIARDYL